jgi:diguanylate cyclase (GGDEF)-like protein/putative nucleotidyltransferase with HDIG domain
MNVSQLSYDEWNAAISLQNVPGSTLAVSPKTQIQDVVELFKQNPEVNGMLLSSDGQLFGMITRDCLFEVLGRPYGNDLYRNKTIHDFLLRYGTKPIIFPWNERVECAVNTALARGQADRYSPVIVSDDVHGSKLVDMHTLLTIQNGLLSRLYETVHQLSLLDPLTHVYNRRGFDEISTDVVADLAMKLEPVSVLMMDIDHFKKVNDCYGHQAGDEVLQTLASVSQAMLRDRDTIIRYGGEEFCVILPGTVHSQALAVAERLREKISQQVIAANQHQIRVTVSIGVTTSPGDVEDLDQLISQADQAMYTAKESGRNRVASYLQQDGNMDMECATLQENEIQTQEMICEDTIWGWVKAMELRDRDTEGHARRVASITLDLAYRLGFQPNDLENIRRGALLHDIGKIAIPDSILFKPGRLTEEEWVVMHRHPVFAYEMLSPVRFLQPAIDIPYCHHEHWDGSGYPRGLKGEEIPLAARIFTVVDVWDALKTDRCYRPAWSDQEIKQYLADQKGRLFDPEIVDLFLTALYPEEYRLEQDLSAALNCA